MRGAKAPIKAFRARELAVLVSLVIVISILLPGLSKADLGVSNDPPAWVDIEISEDDEYIYVNLAVKDLNGWSNVYNATVTVFDGRGDVVTIMTFSQYRALNSTTPGEYWDESVGDYLNPDLSYSLPVEIPPWNWQNAIEEVGLNITFVLTPFPGDTVHIEIRDKALALSEYTGPFSAEYDIPPYFGNNYVYPVSISAIAATIVAVIFTIRRHYSNKLALTIQAREK